MTASRTSPMGVRTIYTKVSKDNVGTLASIVSWSVLTSIVPITVGLVAISGFILRGNPSAQQSVVTHLSQALQGVVTPSEINKLVSVSINHAGLLGIVGLLGVLWGGSSVGGSISTVFQAVFEVRGRNFFIEKLIDIGMIFVFTALMLVIILASAAGTMINRLFTGLHVPAIVSVALGTGISLLAAFLLFCSIYAVFPNVETHFKFRNFWKGALVAAVLFEILSLIWPIYAKFANFQKNGALLGALVLLMAWVYFFSITMLLGAEIVALTSLNQANDQDASVGPAPDGSVPSHVVLRDDEPSSDDAAQAKRRA